jgi:hypothetical protein
VLSIKSEDDAIDGGKESGLMSVLVHSRGQCIDAQYYKFPLKNGMAMVTGNCFKTIYPKPRLKISVFLTIIFAPVIVQQFYGL